MRQPHTHIISIYCERSNDRRQAGEKQREVKFSGNVQAPGVLSQGLLAT